MADEDLDPVEVNGTKVTVRNGGRTSVKTLGSREAAEEFAETERARLAADAEHRQALEDKYADAREKQHAPGDLTRNRDGADDAPNVTVELGEVNDNGKLPVRYHNRTGRRQVVARRVGERTDSVALDPGREMVTQYAVELGWEVAFHLTDLDGPVLAEATIVEPDDDTDDPEGGNGS